MIQQLTQRIGTPKSAIELGGILVCALWLLTGCQLAPSRKLYKPPAAGQIMGSSSATEASSEPTSKVEANPTDLMNALGSLRTSSLPSSLAASPKFASNNTAANNTAVSNSAVSHPPANNTAAMDKTAAGSQQHFAQTIRYAQQGSQFQLSPFAIVRGQSGWVPSNPSGAPQAGVPGSLTDPTPSVTRYQPPPTYGSAVAPGTLGGQGSIAPGAVGYNDGSVDVPNITAPGGYQPRIEIAPLDVYVQEKRTGRIILGGSVNSDLGVAGQVIIDERNFDIRAVPRTWAELFSGYAFRGAGQSFRVELMPGNQVERYTVNWTTPNLFGYTPYSLSLGGFYFTRQYRDWTERRLGGRVGLGYNVTKDLSIGTEIRGENVKISNPRIPGVQTIRAIAPSWPLRVPCCS
jgi:outer membrane protein insertion porin family